MELDRQEIDWVKHLERVKVREEWVDRRELSDCDAVLTPMEREEERKIGWEEIQAAVHF